MNAFVVLGVIWFALVWVRRYNDERPRRRRAAANDETFSHALLPTREWR